jgi:hypothetical protein
MRAQPAVDTVTEAVAFLQSEGYILDLVLTRGGLREAAHSEVQPTETCTVDYQFRFEGDSDPGDENIVLGVRCTALDTKGIVVSAYGKDADPDHVEVLEALTATRQ